MLARRLEEDEAYEGVEAYALPQEERPIAVPQKRRLTVVKKRPRLNTHLRSRCQAVFLLVAVLAMAVTVRSGISASRGYALVAAQQEAHQLEQENERLRIEIAKLKSPQRIKSIAVSELGMEVPSKVYFAHEK